MHGCTLTRPARCAALQDNWQPEARLGAAEAAAQATGAKSAQDFLEKVVKPMLQMEGDNLPVRCVLRLLV